MKTTENPLSAFTSVRLGSVIATVLFSTLLPITQQRFFIFGIGFVHYLLALVYSRRQIMSVISQRTTAVAALLTVLTGMTIVRFSFPLVVYFGFHHAFNEVYITHQQLNLGNKKLGQFRAIAVLLNLLIFLALLRSHPKLPYMRGMWPLLAIGVLSVLYFMQLFRFGATVRQVMDLGAFEIAGIVLVVSSYVLGFRAEFVEVLAYHFLSWGVWPGVKLAKRSWRSFWTYIGLHLGMIAFFLTIAPAGIATNRLPEGFWTYQFMFWSYLHITLSFVLSPAHPQWVTQWFQPAAIPTGAPAAAR